ncbi:MAG: diaminopimelate decarboxylase [Eubacteriales bacterium]|nr:diaminopimelate decarboxylase [Eubacteriales bacterium]MDD4390974.1 diaminopimelate decarboxylase [Eubacteriales bacterium]
MICENLSINEKGHLTFAGVDTVDMAKKYGTPLYLMDEDRIRYKCNEYKNAMKEFFGDNALPLYASKAASFKRIYQVMKDEAMGIDVVSSGEIYTVLKAGATLENAYFHSNNKTDQDIEYAMDNGIGYFVVDNIEELCAIEEEASKRGIKQSILLRITPGIDPHTNEAISTGKVDSKFGSAIETGQAEEMVIESIGKPHIDLCGFHCHIGSQVFDAENYLLSTDVMMNFIADMKAKLGYEAKQLNIGGGFGVKSTEYDPELNIRTEIQRIGTFIHKKAEDLCVTLPKILMEPGRSIVADAGITIYTVGTIKTIPGYKNYVSVDGGMTDNPRFALYQAPYTIYVANRMNEKRDFIADVVGRCCESGDIIQKGVELAETMHNDTLAVLITGAYNYSMASNYNRLPRPPVVMIENGRDYVAVKRESLEDLVRNDI